MDEFVAYIIKNLVSKPEEISVSSFLNEETIRIEIHVAKEDIGKVIGRRGNTINALRSIVRTVATRLGKKIQLDLVQSNEELDHEAVEIENDSHTQNANELIEEEASLLN